MNKFQIENLDFCQSIRDGSANIITGVSGGIDVDVDVSVEALVKVKRTTAVVGAAAAGAVAASFEGKALAVAQTTLVGKIG